MKDFFTPMKIPQKWVCLLAMSFVFGQQAFSSENYVTESIAVSADIMQQKSKMMRIRQDLRFLFITKRRGVHLHTFFFAQVIL